MDNKSVENKDSNKITEVSIPSPPPLTAPSPACHHRTTFCL